MSDQNGTPAPSAPTSAAAIPAAATVAPAPVAAAPATPPGDPTWLPERLERERRKVLEQLGVDNVDDAKAAIARMRAQQDSEKGAEQRAAEAKAQAVAAAAESERYAAIVREHAARMMVGLTDAQKAAVMAIAGDDQASQLRAISALSPTWAKESSTAPAPAPIPPPATTAPGQGAPPAAVQSSTDHRATYESQRKANPFAAAAYGLSHTAEVYGGNKP